MNKSQLQAVVDTAVDGIILMDARGMATLFNPACERIFGYAAGEIVETAGSFGSPFRTMASESRRAASTGFSNRSSGCMPRAVTSAPASASRSVESSSRASAAHLGRLDRGRGLDIHIHRQGRRRGRRQWTRQVLKRADGAKATGTARAPVARA
jgi:PAS domain-containing protein